MEGNTKPPTQETPAVQTSISSASQTKSKLKSSPTSLSTIKSTPVKFHHTSNPSFSTSNPFPNRDIQRCDLSGLSFTNYTPNPGFGDTVGFIWLFTEELRENEMHDNYFDVTDSPFLNETAGSVYYQLKFLTFVPKDIENGIVGVVDADEGIYLDTGTDSIKEVARCIMERAQDAIEEEEVDLKSCGGVYLIEVVYPELKPSY
ncbi:hypothetical protein TWF102_003254 [Orbilia oligospora]|uniref:Uncharacterized protein n=1 Tax=Orbilia oligospora TaxID=2813651 RepID=A0A7C8IZL3_ORBOL|nr:hypothetical protein TWF102_003254 [Orbilia oligospora]